MGNGVRWAMYLLTINNLIDVEIMNVVLVNGEKVQK